jgi:inosine/xanthosine triphosphatase
MRVVLGGTFSPLHKGHKALFQRAFALGEGGKIIVGLTSDDMAMANRSRSVKLYNERKYIVEEYIKSMVKKYPGTKVEIIQITEVFNVPITREIDADALVVSEGRKHIAEETNVRREQCGKPPLQIIAIPHILAQDGLPIKGTRISNGEINNEGRLLGIVRVAVGTGNNVKLRAVKNAFSKIFDTLKLLKTPVTTGVRAQPWDDETITGAKTRAAAALEQAKNAHFGVGIEAGLFWNESIQKYYDVQYCAIQDRGGRVTVGHGSGFYYPNIVLKGVKSGKTVGEVMSKVTGVKHIGSKQGAIGYLSDGLLTREALTEQAVLMALVPRLTELYE